MTRQRAGPQRRGFLLLQGRGAAPGLGCGPLRRNRADRTPEGVSGGILVAERATPEDVGRILASRGTLTVGGAVLSHVGLLSREFGKPSVCLGDGSRVRVLPEESSPGLLELADVVGGVGSPVLAEGDVVLLDGGLGTVRVPGGADPSRRGEVRRAHELLSGWAAEPEDAPALGRIVEAVRDAHGPAFEYVLEAALLHRWIPPGAPARRFIGAVIAGARPRDTVEAGLEELRQTALALARERLMRHVEALRTAEAPDELERSVRRLREDLDRERRWIADLGGDPSEITEAAAPIMKEAQVRRQAIHRVLRARISEAARAPDDDLRRRLGSFLRLARGARRAGIDEPAVSRLEARLREQAAELRARSSTLIVALDSAGVGERAAVGGKAAGLLEVILVLPDGCAIPRGFVVTTHAYRLHLLGETGERLREALRESDEGAISRRARAAILSAEIPDEVARAVDSALTELRAERLAVRSSASVEDGPSGSLAGQFDSVLGVRPGPEVLLRMRQTWASLWNARALRTMAACGLSPLDAGQAVLVQEIVPTRCAGVMATRDPSGRPDTLLVNAAWGFGEGISQGELSGDLVWVRRSTGEILDAEPGRVDRRIVLDPERPGTVEAPLEPGQAGRLSLSEDQLGRLAELARVLEEATGRAQDVEFGFAEDGTLMIFQVRRVQAARRS